MPINFYDLQRLEDVKMRDGLRRTASPDRFGKASNAKNTSKRTHPLLGKLLGQVDTPKK